MSKTEGTGGTVGTLSALAGRERALTEKEYSELLGISQKKAQLERATGGGCPFVKIGHAVRYLPEDVLAYLETCRRRSTSDDGEGR